MKSKAKEIGAFDPKHTFNSLTVYSGNKMAITAAREVATHSGTKYNPLFIQGRPGLGKTHLMHINHGVSRDVLKEWFGHSSLKSTEIYTKLNAVDAFRKIQKNKKVVDLKERKRRKNAT
jgi:chromosomal replication initiator protein